MLLDTSAIVEIFRSPVGSAHFEKIMSGIGQEEVYVSIVQLAEVADWATRNGVPPEKRVEAVKGLAQLVLLDAQICLEAATIEYRRRRTGHTDFGLVDGIILATTRSMGQHVLTFDEDFVGEDDCSVIS